MWRVLAVAACLLDSPLWRRDEREVRKAKIHHRPRHHPNIPRIPLLNQDDTCGSLHGCLASSIGWMGVGMLKRYQYLVRTMVTH